MSASTLRVLFSWSTLSLLALAACGGGDDVAAPTSAPTLAAGSATVSPPTKPSANEGADRPGPAPTGCGTLAKDKDGFITRNSGKGEYVLYVPKSYNGGPTRLLVGLHGCGDDAYNFATWGINPYDTRGDQDYIGLAVGGETGGSKCWNVNADADKVEAAIADVSKCVYVHQQKIVLAGYSSGGELAYSMALKDATHVAGLLILDSSVSSAGNADQLLAGAARKLDIAHRAHKDDDVYPLDGVEADWAIVKSAGFPLQTSIGPGTHDGTSEDWSGWLLGKMKDWKAP